MAVCVYDIRNERTNERKKRTTEQKNKGTNALTNLDQAKEDITNSLIFLLLPPPPLSVPFQCSRLFHD